MTQRIFHRIYVRVLSWLGLAVNIHSKGKWPSYALSNFYHNSFVFDGISCRSMEGFIQSLKCVDRNEQLRVSKCEGNGQSSSGKKSKAILINDIEVKGVCWKGVFINRHSEEYQSFIRKVYRAMFDLCPKFREALKATGTKHLFHTIGNPDSHKTILTEKELCDILTELRNKL